MKLPEVTDPVQNINSKNNTKIVTSNKSNKSKILSNLRKGQDKIESFWNNGLNEDLEKQNFRGQISIL